GGPAADDEADLFASVEGLLACVRGRTERNHRDENRKASAGKSSKHRPATDNFPAHPASLVLISALGPHNSRTCGAPGVSAPWRDKAASNLASKCRQNNRGAADAGVSRTISPISRTCADSQAGGPPASTSG